MLVILLLYRTSSVGSKKYFNLLNSNAFRQDSNFKIQHPVFPFFAVAFQFAQGGTRNERHEHTDAALLKQVESLKVFSPANISITLYSHMLFKRCACTIFRGLYIGYLKLRTSVDAIHVVVQENCPNVLPHVKIRDNPNVSR